MIRPNKHNEDGLPVELAWKDEDHNEDGLPVAIKKKVGSALVGGLSAANGGQQKGFGGAIGAAAKEVPDQNKQKVLDYMYSLKSPEEKEMAKDYKGLAYNKGKEKLEEIVSTGGHDDPIGVAQKGVVESTDMQDKLKNYMANRYFNDSVDGADAKQILETTDFGKKGEDNVTSNVLRGKVAKYENATTPLKSMSFLSQDKLPDLSTASDEFLDNWITPDLNKAAIEYGIRKDPEFAKYLQKLGINITDNSGFDLKNKIGSFKIGQWMDRMMNDSDVVSYLKKENPYLIPAFQRASKQLRVDNLDYGINQVASEVSRAVQKTGFNNIDPIINYYGDEHKKMANQVAEQLYRDDPNSMAIYNKHIRDDQESHLDAPSFVQGVGEAGKDFGEGILNTLTEPFKSVSQDIRDKWQKEAENISADPDGVSKFLRNMGHTLGTVLSIAATGNVIGNTAAVGTGFFGDILKEKKLKFDNPITAYTSAFLNTGLYMLMGERIFPADKVKAAFGEISPEIDNVVQNLASGKITRDVAKEQFIGFGKRAIDFVGGTLSKNAKITTELILIDKAGEIADQVMGGNPVKEDDAEKAVTTFLSNLGVAGLAKAGDMRRGNEIVQRSLDKAASEPLQTGRAIDLLTESQEVKDNMKSNLDFITKVKKDLVNDGIPSKQHSRYLLEALREKVAKEEMEKKTDPTIQKKDKEIIKEANEIKERIVAGEDAETIVTEKEQKAIDKSEEAKVELERLSVDHKLELEKIDAQIEKTDGRESEENRIKLKELNEKKKRAIEDFESDSTELKKKVIEEEKPHEEKPVVTPEGVGNEKVDIEKRRADELPLKPLAILPDYKERLVTWERKTKEVNDKYDSELAALEKPKPVEQSNVGEVENNNLVDRKEVDNVVIPEGIEKEMFWQEKLVEHTLNELGIDYKKERSKSSPSSYYRIKTKDGNDFKLRVSDHDKKYPSDGNVQYNEKTTPQEIMDRLRDEIPDESILRKQTLNETTKQDNKPDERQQAEAQEPPITEPNQVIEPAKEGTGGGKEAGEQEGIRLAHADTKNIYQRHNLAGRLETPTKKDSELETAADKLVENGYDFDAESDKVMKGDKKSFTDEEQVAFAKMVGALEAKQEGMDINSAEFNSLQDKIEKYSRASDIVGTLEARGFRARQLFQSKDETKADYVMREKEAAQSETLTEQQKETVQKEYEDISKAKKDFDEYMAKKEAEFSAKQAKVGFEKQKPTTKTKKTKEDFVTERASLKEKLIAAGKEHEDWLKEQGIQKSGFGSFTFKEAKIIGEYIKSYAQEGIQNFSDAVKKVIDEVKDLFPGIDEKDIHDIASGVYNEKKPTKSELATRLMDWRLEASLISKLSDLERGVEPKSEKGKRERNKQITELRGKIKSLQQAEANAEREIKEFEKEKTVEQKETISTKASEKKDLEKDLTKAEKELQKAEEAAEKERERKIIEVQKAEEAARKEEEKFIREFEKEKDSETKTAAKAKVDAAKKLAADLAKKTKTEIALDRQKTKMAKEIKELEYKLKTGDFDKESAPKKAALELDAEGKKLRDKLINLKDERTIRLLKEQYKNRSFGQRALNVGKKIIGIPRVLKSSFDVSMPFRQGLWGVTRQLWTLPFGKNKGFRAQKQLAREFGQMYGAMGNEKTSERIMNDIRTNERYENAQKAGLNIADPESQKSKEHEEAFGVSYADQIPFLGKSIPLGKEGIKIPGTDKKISRVGGLVKASERAATTFVNSMKWTIYNGFADIFESQGKTYENAKKDYEAAAIYANQSVGRGRLGKKLENANAITSRLFFSLRLQASRLQLMTNIINPAFYMRVPKEIRHAYWRDSLKFAGTMMAVNAVAYSLGFGINANPFSSGFGKLKVGDTEYDVMGGFSQWFVFIMRQAFGKTENNQGETVSLKDDRTNRLELGLRMARSKESPEAAFITNVAQGKNYLGQKTDAGKEGLELVKPLIYSDIKDVAKEGNILKTVLTGLLAAHGLGVATYDHSKPSTSSSQKGSRETRKHETRHK